MSDEHTPVCSSWYALQAQLQKPVAYPIWTAEPGTEETPICWFDTLT